MSNCEHYHLRYEATVEVAASVADDGTPWPRVINMTTELLVEAEDGHYHCINCNQNFDTWKAARQHLNTAYKETP